jgi:integrase
MIKSRLTSPSGKGSDVIPSEDGIDQTSPGSGGLKNVFLVQCSPPRLYEVSTGEPVPSFNVYARNIHRKRGKKRADITNKQYVGHNAGLMDFLYECRALGAGPIDPDALNETLESYYTFLTEGIYSDDYIIRTVAKRLGRNPITIPSALKVKAAANDLLRRHAAVLRDSLAKVRILHPERNITAHVELPVLADRQRSISEIEQMRLNLMEFKEKPNSAYLAAEGGLESGRMPKNGTRKDFPTRHILTLIQNLPLMEKAIALFQCGGGLRQSEVWAIRRSEINLKERTIRVEDPNHLRDPSAKELPFKGRTTANIYVFEPFKKFLFDAIAEYLAIRPTTNSDYLFVSDANESYGEPLLEVLEANSLNRRLNRALATAQIRNNIYKSLTRKKAYTSHSLRHFYGYWARNFVYMPGRPTVGLTLAEIQVLMGHSDIKSTLRYAILDTDIFMAEISASEELSAIWNTTKSIDSLRADAYEALAIDLRNRLKEAA